MLKSYLFWGYTKQSVEDEMDRLEDNIQLLTEQLHLKDETIARLNEQLRRAKSEEQLIKESIMDARALSKRIVKEAQEQAQLLMSYVENDVNKQLDEINHNIDSLKQSKTSMLSREAIARQKLKESLHNYLTLIDEHSTTFDHQNNVLEVDFQNVADNLKKTRNVLNQTASEHKATFATRTADNTPTLKQKA